MFHCLDLAFFEAVCFLFQTSCCNAVQRSTNVPLSHLHLSLLPVFYSESEPASSRRVHLCLLGRISARLQFPVSSDFGHICASVYTETSSGRGLLSVFRGSAKKIKGERGYLQPVPPKALRRLGQLSQ